MCEYIRERMNFDLDCLDGIEDILQNVTGNDKQVAHNIRTPLEQEQQEQRNQEQNQQQQQQRQQQLNNLQQYSPTAAVNKFEGENFTSSSSSSPPILPPPSPLSAPSLPQQLPASPCSPSKESVNNTQSSISSMSRRNSNLVTCMLITANVGTIFEESTLLELWFQQLESYLVKIKPQLVAIHCQEVGGKNFETSMKNVSSFTDKILGDDKIIGDYSRVRIFLDENYECLEKFTALGSLYLVHDSVDNVKLYNFKTAQYDVIEGRNVFAVSDKNDLLKRTSQHTASTSTPTSARNNLSCNNVDQRASNGIAEHVEKIKFPLELFPECRWSRKGFMRTRWLINDCQPLDLVNIHLFHDASNLVAMKSTPSPYAQNRQKALEFALRKLSEPLKVVVDNNNGGQTSLNLDETATVQRKQQQQHIQKQQYPKEYNFEHEQVPLFIFGDFNFRLDTNKVIQRITEGVSPVVKKNAGSDEVVEFVYHRKVSDCSASQQLYSPDEVETEKDTTTDGRNKDNGDKNDQSLEESLQQDGGNADDGGVLMTVGKKLFDLRNLDETFHATKNTEWLLELDNELDSFKSQLYEFKIAFSPSYPFKEDETGGYSYMKTRCPAWCDRILFNEAGYRLIRGRNSANNVAPSDNATSIDSEKRIELLQDHGDVSYRLMGNSVPMGDHKPVLLYCKLSISQQNPSSNCDQTVATAAETESAATTTTTATAKLATSATSSAIEETSGGLVKSTAM